MRRMVMAVPMGWFGLAGALALAGCDADAATHDAEASTVDAAGDGVDGDAAADAADATQAPTGPGVEALLALMRAEDGARYTSAVDAGATFHASANGQTFYAFWAPAGFDPEVDGVVVSVGGHDTFACSDVVVWRPFLEPRRYALIAIQWWYGSGEGTSDYMTPGEMLPILREALDAQGIPRGRALLHGFSRGAANSYALTALDHVTAVERAFLMTLANAGGMAPGYPPNQAIIDGSLGDGPLEGSHWVLFCGGRDPDPELSGCPAMHASEGFLVGQRAIVDRFIEDPTAGHGGLHLVPANAAAALDAYAERLALLGPR